MFMDFTAENMENKVEELKAKLAESKEAIDKLLDAPEKSYLSIVRPYQMVNERLEWFFKPISILSSTKDDEVVRKVYEESLSLLTEFHTDQKQDIRFYNVFKEILENEAATLTQSQKKVLEDEILSFELSGAGLPEAKQKRIKEINIELSTLSNTFSQNLLDANRAYEMIIEDPKNVEGVPASDLNLAKREEGGWKFTLQMPSYVAYMTYGPNRELREKLYQAYVTRAPENEELITKIMALRDEESKLLGYENFAQVSLVTKMAPSPEEVVSFLEELAVKAKPQGEKERDELKAFAAEQGCPELRSWDVAYYAKKLEKATFDLDEEAYRPYFEKERTVQGLFDFVGKMFAIEFEPVEAPVWDDTVKVFHLKREGKLLARFYTDLENRDSKRGGAWMDSWQGHCLDENGDEVLASAYISCNFAPSTADQPSLLKHDDVVTLFHEMGHAVHHMFSQIDEPFVSGIAGVEWDAVEFPSQFLENFAYEKEVLSLFAQHYETGETLPEGMIRKLIDAKNFQSAMGMLRQLEFSIFDMKIHMGLHDAKQVQEILDAVREKVAVLTPPEYNKFQHSFGHIFSGGYAAGYYSYKWAEVLSADAYFAFVDRGVFDKEIADKLFDNVLSKGGSESAMTLFENFMGRKPEVDALLRLSGIQAA